MPIIPAQRVPTPILAGNANPDVTHSPPAGTPQILIPLKGPRVGTAWSLGGFSLTISVPVTGATGSDDWLQLNGGLDLLLDGEVVDNFPVSWAIPGADIPATPNQNPNIPFTQVHQYNPGFVIYDSSSLALRNIGGFGWSHLTPTNLAHLHWRGNVTYI